MISNKNKKVWDWYNNFYLCRVIKDPSIAEALVEYNRVSESGYGDYNPNNKEQFVLTKKVVTSKLVKELFKGLDI